MTTDVVTLEEHGLHRPQVPVATAIGAAANAATLAWAGIAAYVSNRGLGSPDEGFYLLAYRHWSENPRTFTGAQYLYGPLLDLCGGDIGLLRLCRLALVLGVHVRFAVSFVRWLRVERPQAVPDRATAYCCGSLIVATGPILYGWLPATPGYNDVTALGSLVLLSVLLGYLRAAAVGRRLGWSGGVAYGATVAIMVLARPPVALSLVVVVVGTVYALRLADARGGGRVVLAAIGGVAAFALVVHVLVAPWSAIVPPMHGQLAVASANSHPPLRILAWDLSTMFTAAADALIICVPLVGTLLVARRRSQWTESRRVVLGLLGLLASVALAVSVGGFQAGEDHALAYSATVLAMLVIVLGTSVRRMSTLSTSGRVIAGALLVLPVLQAFGTNLVLYSIAVNASAAWVALMLLVGRPSRSQSRLSALIPTAATVVAVAVAVSVGIGGVSHDDRGRPVLTGPVRHADGVPELSSLLLPEEQALAVGTFRSDLGDLVVPDRPMLAFGDLAQYVLVLGGRPIGEAWYSAEDDGFNRADLDAACRGGNPWGDVQPLVLASRAPSHGELAGWHACGIDFDRDYVDVTPSSAPHGVHVLAPRTGVVSADD